MSHTSKHEFEALRTHSTGLQAIFRTHLRENLQYLCANTQDRSRCYKPLAKPLPSRHSKKLQTRGLTGEPSWELQQIQRSSSRESTIQSGQSQFKASSWFSWLPGQRPPWLTGIISGQGCCFFSLFCLSWGPSPQVPFDSSTKAF